MTDFRVVRKLRASLLKVAAVIETEDSRLSHTQLVAVSVATSPSTTRTYVLFLQIVLLFSCDNHALFVWYVVPAGGFLFEYYMYSCAGYTNNRRWLSFVNDVDNEALSEYQQSEIINDNLNGFVGWLLLHIGQVGSNGRGQLFYITFICQYFGLSRSGIECMASYGYGVTKSMFDDYKKMYCNRSIANTRYQIDLDG